MKIKTGLYFLANLFVPLSEARYTKNRIIPSLGKQLQRSVSPESLLRGVAGSPS